MGGHGLGGQLVTALVDAADQRVEYAFAEMRTVHSKTQRMADHLGLVPLGFLPMHYRTQWRESWILSGQLFGNGRGLRRVGEAAVIPAVAPLARLSLRNLELDEPVAVRDAVRPYPVDDKLLLTPLTGASLLNVLKIEAGRLVDTEVFGGVHIDEGISQLGRHKATYLVATDGDRPVGAVGYRHNPRHGTVRVVELIGQDNAAKGALLRWALARAEGEHKAEIVECDVSAYSPRVQQTLYELGFLPTAYVPGMVFHRTARHDVVRMTKVNVAWDLGPCEFTDSARAYHDVVVTAFERAGRRS